MKSSTLFRKALSEVYSLRYASSFFLKVPKKLSATALSWGLPLAEKDWITPLTLSRFVNALEVYCLPRSLWKVKSLGFSRSTNAYLKVAVTSCVLAFSEMRYPMTHRENKSRMAQRYRYFPQILKHVMSLTQNWFGRSATKFRSRIFSFLDSEF